MKGKPGDEWSLRVEELMLLHCLERGEGVSEMQLKRLSSAGVSEMHLRTERLHGHNDEHGFCAMSHFWKDEFLAKYEVW